MDSQQLISLIQAKEQELREISLQQIRLQISISELRQKLGEICQHQKTSIRDEAYYGPENDWVDPQIVSHRSCRDCFKVVEACGPECQAPRGFNCVIGIYQKPARKPPPLGGG